MLHVTVMTESRISYLPFKGSSPGPTSSTGSSVITSYPSITLFGSYAKGTARPDSDVDIAIFHPDLIWDKNRQEIGGVHMDLEDALNKEADLSVCPPDTFVERIKKYWVPINVGTQKSSSLLSSSADATHPPVALPSMSS
ncbi:hypothetical protein APHAL10511_005461 [Amanita phalloides]|nr:hypothetical protein APHAL10511_005461 [Amanita phalloides]